MPTTEFDRILAVQNPASSQVGKADETINWLRGSRWGGALEVMQTRHPREGDNVELIRDRLQEGTVVLSFGGDGLGNDVFNAIALASEEGDVDADSVSMMGLPTGNGNDLSLSVYGGDILRDDGLRKVLERPETVALDGMRLVASNPSGEVDFSKFAHSYISLGFTGQAAAAINRWDFRAMRRSKHPLVGRVLDGIQVLGAAKPKRRQPFQYRNGSAEVRHAQEILFSMRPRVAAGVIRIDTDPFDQQAVSLELGHRVFVINALRTVGLGRLNGGAKGEAMGSQRELELQTGTAIQYDGEPFALPAGTSVKIQHHPRLVRTLVKDESYD